MMNEMLAVCAGVGLAAACGFRVFVPLLIAALAVRGGAAQVTPTYSWISSDLALAMLAVATLVEVVAYYVPWLDHALDTVASPAAVVAGTLSAGVFVPGSMDPALHWALALIVGGGVAGVVQAGSVATRAASGVTTLGIANPVVATVENVGAVGLAGLAIFVPAAAGALAVIVVLTVLICLRKLIRFVLARRARSDGSAVVTPVQVARRVTAPPALPN